MKNLLQLLALCAALLALWGCGPDDAPPEPDPCADEPENLAAFKATDYVSGFYKTIVIEEPDSLIADGFFIYAQHEAEMYKCFIGKDTVIDDDPDIYLDFEEEFRSHKQGGWKDVTLIAYGKPTECYPNGRIDTMTKRYYFWPHTEFEARKERLTGAYHYQNLSNPNDEGYCYIKDSLQPPSFDDKRFYFWNFPGLCELPMDINIYAEHIRVGTEVNAFCRGDGFAKTNGFDKRFIFTFYKADQKVVNGELDVELEESKYLFTKNEQ